MKTNVLGGRSRGFEAVRLFGVLVVVALLPFVAFVLAVDAVLRGVGATVRRAGRDLRRDLAPPEPNTTPN